MRPIILSRREPRAMRPMGEMSPMRPMRPIGKNTQNNTKTPSEERRRLETL